MAGPKGSGAIDVDGLDETRRAFRRAADRADRIEDQDTEAAHLIEEDARRRVPVLSGDLRATIHTARASDHAVVVAGGPLVPYARVIQDGWPARNIEPQPYLDDRRRADVIEFYGDDVNDLVRAFDRDAP